MERDGLAHRLTLWVAMLAIAALLLGLGFTALARLQRVPELPIANVVEYSGDGDTGVYQGDGDTVLVVDGKEVGRWHESKDPR